ncbi:MAG: hypothetical protein LC745_04705, partial [Planctomycetia bacterium]|nr:hypothetical protein [Planctomycetia bacterium]
FRTYRKAGLLAVGLLLVLWGLSNPPLLMGLFGLTVLVVFAHAWLREFSFLMDLTDKDFPGRYDKPIWAFVLIATGPVGLWLFHAHRAAHWPSTATEGIGPRRSTDPTPAADLF